MRKNHENTNEIVTSNHYKLKDLQETAREQQPKINYIYEHLRKQSFQKDMNAPDIGDFFPVENPSQLELFMDRSNPLWDARREEFHNLLYTCLTNQKNIFSKGLIQTLFTRQYIRTVQWPSPGYCHSLSYIVIKYSINFFKNISVLGKASIRLSFRHLWPF